MVEMAVSTNSRHIALLSDSGKLWIGSSDIRIKYCEYDAKSQVKPRQLAWWVWEVWLLNSLFCIISASDTVKEQNRNYSLV